MIKWLIFWLWLVIWGGGRGYVTAPVVLAELIAALFVWLWFSKTIVAAPRLTLWRPGLALAAVALAVEIATLTTNAWQYGPLKAAIWTTYMAAAYLAAAHFRPGPIPHRAALVALIVYTPFTLTQWDNPNVAALNLLALGLISLPAWGALLPMLWVFLLAAMVKLDCMAGLMATVTALAVYYPIPHKRATLMTATPAALLLAFWHSSPSFYFRLQFWADALSAWPWGVGPGNYYLLNGWPHAHNTALNLVAETGFMGLVALAVAAALCVTHRAVTDPVCDSPREVTPPGEPVEPVEPGEPPGEPVEPCGEPVEPWPIATLAAFAVWCVLDDPWQVLAPALVMVLSLANVQQNTMTGMTLVYDGAVFPIEANK